MAECLQPSCQLTVQEKIKMFFIRSEMNDIPYNFGRKEFCQKGCLTQMDNDHILNCPVLNDNPHGLKYSYILNGSHRQEIEVFRKGAVLL